MKTLKACIGFAACVAACGQAIADNAALTAGGRPTMLDRHPSISMESEVVKLVVHWNRVDAEAVFVFANHGAACNVTMGFPDFGLWAYGYRKTKPGTMFKSFHSFVDGSPVKTKLVLDRDHRGQWQTKVVSFKANGKRVVREVYTTAMGGAAVDKEPWAFACYLLHTGASWKGNIGKATITVAFDPDSEVKGTIDMVYGEVGKLRPSSISDQIRKAGGVVVSGPSKPVVQGRTLRFETENWRPTEKDDIYVVFAYPKRLIKWEDERLKKIRSR